MERADKAEIADPVARLLSGYERMPGVPDELIGADGGLRPAWRGFIAALAATEREDLEARKARGDRYLRDAGVFFRQYGPQAASERDWPLSHMPVLIAEDEWRRIEAGLVQRADLLERIAADLYGESRLVTDGHLPPELVAGNAEWLRPMVGVAPRGGHYLHFLAFDIGRGPSGDWWVIGDRVQAPSGAGFALESRIATARVFSEQFSRLNVHRLAGFFKAFHSALNGLGANEDRRIAVLTPGAMNDTYYEHAYLARYLGLMLLEGEDLTVVRGELMVRTVAGLKPVGVLWRRLDARWIDPLELEQSSQLGTPGMLDAVRSGTVTLVNALGSGVLEARALMAFLPRIAEALTGQPLVLPNIATWWCGQDAEREFVKANAETMTISDAFATAPLFERDDMAVVGGRIDAARGESLAEWVDREGSHLVGQEAITLSTTPAFDGGHLKPRPTSLRVFLARTASGWTVMPGGLARIGRPGASAELAMQRGGAA
ncbi:MAG: circularly permuted type 2 ATP-grasp protein, partial [Alphaproteobacteria bacterium]|nr:circularly permuted type 2 ATP-grasp protein [Alphaproteobacteria bacterium]